jgi:nicotinate-nucleotide pyrophosphorylase (carboxylating)
MDYLPVIDRLIEMALEEDIGHSDITTDNLVDPGVPGKGELVAKEAFVLAGIGVARAVFLKLDPECVFQESFVDGDEIGVGQTVMTVSGGLRALLVGERTALNFLQRLSGVATRTRAFVKILKGFQARLVDTRKTTPGFRLLEKYAVRVGGGANHRFGLYDGVLIKDNHIAICGGIQQAVERIRGRVSHLVKIEVEAADINQVRDAVEAGVDVIMLDNMNPARIREAVSFIDGRALVEVSGGVTEDNLRELAGCGVDIISSGALTHSATAVDISMKIGHDQVEDGENPCHRYHPV